MKLNGASSARSVKIELLIKGKSGGYKFQIKIRDWIFPKELICIAA